MAQLIAILIVGVAHAVDRGVTIGGLDQFRLRGWPAAAIVWGAIGMIVFWHGFIARLCDRRLGTGGGPAYLGVADRASMIAQWLVLLSYTASVLVFGWHDAVQQVLGGDVVLGDVVITITPPIVGLMAIWSSHYLLVKRVRDAALIRAFDEGQPVHAMPSRWRYVLLQLRLNVLFLLVPLLLIVTWSDLMEIIVPVAAIPSEREPYDELLNQGLTLAGAFGIFILAPLMARVVLDLHRLPDGAVRDRLLKVCRDHNVRVRGVLIWRTGDTMINGAVMGIFGRLRYIMLTDALLERMSSEQIEAVMAHEIGHVKRHHMPWLIAVLFSVVMLPSIAIDSAWRWWIANGGNEAAPLDAWMEYAVLGSILVFAFFAFGWISRRFERQADTFAVQHLSGLRERGFFRGNRRDDGGVIITDDAVAALRSALDRVCQLNGIDPSRKSWRHGSIRWRQGYVAGLVGRPLRGLAIDRQIGAIKIVTAVVLAIAIPLAIHDITAGSTGIEAPTAGPNEAFMLGERWRALRESSP